MRGRPRNKSHRPVSTSPTPGPCPWCHGADGSTPHVEGHGEYLFVICSDDDLGCGASGPWEPSEIAAIREWNTVARRAGATA